MSLCFKNLASQQLEFAVDTTFIATALQSGPDGNYDAVLNSFWYELPLKEISAELLAYYEYKSASTPNFVIITDDKVLFGVPDVATPKCRVTLKTAKESGNKYPKYSAVQVAATQEDRLAIAAANKAVKAINHPAPKKQTIDMNSIKL
jgi:hypothetical protein